MRHRSKRYENLKTLKHLVQCMGCGRIERIEITQDRKIRADWKYYGKLNTNYCKTDRFFYKLKEGKKLGDKDPWVKIPNTCYDPKAKRKMVELWSCGKCVRKI